MTLGEFLPVSMTLAPLQENGDNMSTEVGLV